MELKTENLDKDRGQGSTRKDRLKRILFGVSLIALGMLTLAAGLAARTVRFLRYLDVPQVVFVAGLILLVVRALKLSPGLAAKLDPAGAKAAERNPNSAEPGHAACGMVEYSIPSTAVVIDSERGAASVWFYRIQDGKRFYLTPAAIDEYLHTSSSISKN